jgi:hypothetical protein
MPKANLGDWFSNPFTESFPRIYSFYPILL